jgi:geranylgeranyl diphosphate synthase type II
MKLNLYLKEKKQLVENRLSELLPCSDDYSETLYKAMHYSVFAGGKRLRPILVIAGAEAVGGCGEDVLDIACALEMIHTYSLIHDDLPAMDNDDYRRGILTNHKVYGEGMAILAGDALLTQAFVVLGSISSVANGKKLNIVREIAQAAGAKGMVGGQAVDILSEGKAVDRATLQFIHKNKTGALIRAAVRSGAIFAGAAANELRALSAFAEEFGLLFQITDDILDVIGNKEKLGKPVGSDAELLKATYPALFGLEKSKELANKAMERALAALSGLGPGADPLRQLTRFLLVRDF